MYPYEMASELRGRGKDQAIKINWGSFYTVVQNLEKYSFIEAVNVGREGRQPERTTYQITEAGMAELKDWLRELLSVPEREYTRFEAALGEAAVLPPDEVASLLRQRLEQLDAAIAEYQAGMTTWAAGLPRLFLIEFGVLPGAAPGRGGVGPGAAEGAHRRHVPRPGRLASLPRDGRVPRGPAPALPAGGARGGVGRNGATTGGAGRRRGHGDLSERPRPGAATPGAGAVNLRPIPRERGTRGPTDRVAGFLLAGLERHDAITVGETR